MFGVPMFEGNFFAGTYQDGEGVFLQGCPSAVRVSFGGGKPKGIRIEVDGLLKVGGPVDWAEGFEVREWKVGRRVLRGGIFYEGLREICGGILAEWLELILLRSHCAKDRNTEEW